MKPIVKDLRSYAGPVAQAYENNQLIKSVIIGPIAGGKTESSIRRILRVARAQHPSPIDGVRKCRIVCVGTTYRDLWDKAIEPYLNVFNKAYGQWSGGKGDPATHIMDFLCTENRGGRVVQEPLHLEVWFRAKSGEQTMEEFVRGLKPTGWWFPEIDQQPKELVDQAMQRLGRYPEMDDRWDPENPVHAAHIKRMGWAPAWTGIFGDTNRPTVDNWLDTEVYKNKTFGNGAFLQPAALLDDGTVNPKAENLHNLRKSNPRYYEALASKMIEYDKNRFLKCKRVYDRRGQAVHSQFKAESHVATRLPINPRLPLVIGADTGGTLKHAAIFGQPELSGRLNVLHEISPRDRQTTINAFARELVQIKDTRFPMCHEVILIVDPAAKAKMVQNDTMELIEYWKFLQGMTGFDTIPASSNDPNWRVKAADFYLEKTDRLFVDGDYCPDLVAGLEGGYAWRKLGAANQPVVLKNDYSHLAEAFQYLCLYLQDNPMGLGGQFPPQPDGGYDQGPEF